MSIEIMKQALEALEYMTKIRNCQREKGYPLSDADKKMQEAITSLRQAIAEAERVATNDISKERVDETPKNVHEPKREWVGLTDEEVDFLMPHVHNDYELVEFANFADAIEAKLKEKNMK